MCVKHAPPCGECNIVVERALNSGECSVCVESAPHCGERRVCVERALGSGECSVCVEAVSYTHLTLPTMPDV